MHCVRWPICLAEGWIFSGDGRAWCGQHAPNAQRVAANEVKAWVAAELKRMRARGINTRRVGPRYCRGCGEVLVVLPRLYCLQCKDMRMKRQRELYKLVRECPGCGQALAPYRRKCSDCEAAIRKEKLAKHEARLFPKKSTPPPKPRPRAGPGRPKESMALPVGESPCYCRTHRAEQERLRPGRWRWVEAPAGEMCCIQDCDRRADAQGIVKRAIGGT